MSGVPTGMNRIFRAHRDDFYQRVTTLEGAVAAIAAGRLDHALRESAERDAHKLVGSLGTFGLARGTALARELETTSVPVGPRSSPLSNRTCPAVSRRCAASSTTSTPGSRAATTPRAASSAWPRPRRGWPDRPSR